jgi:serine/threonine-protein kinase
MRVGLCEPPLTFGRYTLVERLGTGGMGEVFRAKVDGDEDASLVIKRLRPELTSSPALVDMFLRQARLCALLDHPNLLPVREHGQIDGGCYLAYEDCPGKDLLALAAELRAASDTIPLDVAAFIAAEVAHGLAHAQKQRPQDGTREVVHLDVTPSKILLLRSGGVKLVPFGTGTFEGAADLSDIGRKSLYRKKLGYLAPERLDGRPDGRSHVFSLGVVLWEAIIGRSLFRAGTDAETLKNVRSRTVPPPSHFRPEVPEALDAVVLRALERDPDRRFSDALEMARALEAIVDDERFHSRSIAATFQELLRPGARHGVTPVPLPAPPLTPAPLLEPALEPLPSARALLVCPPPPPPRRAWSGAGFALVASVAVATFLAGGVSLTAWMISDRAPATFERVAQARPPAPLIVPLPAAPGAPQAEPPRAPALASPRPVRARQALDRRRTHRARPAARAVAASPEDTAPDEFDPPAPTRGPAITLDPFASGEAPIQPSGRLW